MHLEGYADIDHFRESERYAKAESIPLDARNFSVLRAALAMPACTLSLVRTFPRIVNGYDLAGRLLIVIPMNGIASARINGEAVGQSVILLKGGDCTVVEPEARLVAILAIRADATDSRWRALAKSHLLLDLPAVELNRIRTFILRALEFAATRPEAIMAADVLDKMQLTLLSAIEAGLRSGTEQTARGRLARTRHLQIVREVDAIIGLNPLDASNEKLADEIGVSVRTLQTASQAICGLSAHEYARLRRLWSMRRQLRTGAAGLTVKASALAHGFWHMGELSRIYRYAFDELPSQTLEQAKVGSRATYANEFGHGPALTR